MRLERVWLIVRAASSAASAQARRCAEELHADGVTVVTAVSGPSSNPFPGLLATWFEDPTHFRPPGGETLAETQERGWQALQEILGEGGEEEVRVVVTHQLVLASILCRLSDVPLSKFRKFSHGNTGVTTVEVGPEGLRLCSLNDLAHLPPAP